MNNYVPPSVDDIIVKIQNYKTLIPRGKQVIYAISVIYHNLLKQPIPSISDMDYVY